MEAAAINVKTRKSRKVAQDLTEHTKYVQIQTNPGVSDVWHDWDSVWDEFVDGLSIHYGVDMENLIAKPL